MGLYISSHLLVCGALDPVLVFLVHLLQLLHQDLTLLAQCLLVIYQLQAHKHRNHYKYCILPGQLIPATSNKQNIYGYLR